jgi:uncharacterized integral membrane protein
MMRTETGNDPSVSPKTLDQAPDGWSEQSLDTISSVESEPEPETSSEGVETEREHFRRKALRAQLHGRAIAMVVLVAVLIALAASNTGHVKVNWLFGSSHIGLVWLVLVTALLGWALGLISSARFHWLTRAPRRNFRHTRGSHPEPAEDPDPQSPE